MFLHYVKKVIDQIYRLWKSFRRWVTVLSWRISLKHWEISTKRDKEILTVSFQAITIIYFISKKSKWNEKSTLDKDSFIWNKFFSHRGSSSNELNWRFIIKHEQPQTTLFRRLLWFKLCKTKIVWKSLRAPHNWCFVRMSKWLERIVVHPDDINIFWE